MAISVKPVLLPGEQYLNDLIERINSTSYRIAIVTTIFHNDSEHMEHFVQALCAAAERGVDVSFCVDTYTYLEPNGPWRHLLKDQSAQAYRAIRNERRLKNAGVKFRWLGRNANFGVMGRTHTKWSIVDDTVYSFGGVNLYEMGICNTDYMFRITNQDLSDAFYTRHAQLIKADKGNHAGKNRSIELSSRTHIIFDGGMPFHSEIYDRAVELAHQAESILFVSQYCPTGKLARALRNNNARLYFNHWETASALNTLVIKAGMRSSQFETMYEREPYLHAKFIIYTMPNGTKWALTGSHNFQTGGVILGTRELCLETTSTGIIAELETFFEQYVK